MNIFNNLDPEKLIASVKSRRILYDRWDKLFHRYRLKKEIWSEICEELNLNFKRLSLLQKVEYSREIQKRWKNLRTCFTRELCLQKREQLAREKNLPVKKRKRYEYFEQLLFLRDCDDGTEEDMGHDNRHNGRDDNESTNSTDAVFIENVPVEYVESKNVDVNSDILVSMKTFTDMDTKKAEIYEKSINERLLDILKDTHKNDDDRQFVLSLLPMFKDLNNTKKLEARIEILGLLQNLTFKDD